MNFLGIGGPELVLLLLLAVLLFGGKLPEVGRTVGRYLREFRKLSQEMTQLLHEDDEPRRSG